MEIALVTEGTYPHSYGGVSVWCDQLVRGMPGHRFTVHAITATGDEQIAWELPENVTVVSVPVWGTARSGRPPKGAAARLAADLYRELFECLVGEGSGDASGAVPGVAAADDDAFAGVLRELFDLSRAYDLSAALRTEEAIRWLLDAWSGSGIWLGRHGWTPTVHDALTGVELLEHTLRALRAPAAPARVTHAVANGLAVLVGLAAKWEHGTPLVLTEHGVYLRERYLGYRASPYGWPVKALMLRFLRLLCRTGYEAADLVTPGNRYNQRWEVRCGADPGRLRTVYNGVDPAHFPPAGEEPAEPTISWAGRIDPIKDTETLIRAFALVRAELPAARLRLFGGVSAGSEAYRDRCQRLIEDLGLADAATFEGRVENIRDAYAAGHVVVLSSISEGFPYTLIEAMTSGRATVSTDVGGVTEAVGDTGLVVPPRDPGAMAAACVALLRDDDRRHRLGAASRERALEFFTVEQAVDSFRGIYASLAAADAPAVRQ